MSVTEILSSVQFVTDAEGKKKAVQVDLAVWKEIVVLLERLEVDAELAAWDALSDEALSNFEAELETGANGAG